MMLVTTAVITMMMISLGMHTRTVLAIIKTMVAKAIVIVTMLVTIITMIAVIMIARIHAVHKIQMAMITITAITVVTAIMIYANPCTHPYTRTVICMHTFLLFSCIERSFFFSSAARFLTVLLSSTRSVPLFSSIFLPRIAPFFGVTYFLREIWLSETKIGDAGVEARQLFQHCRCRSCR